VRNGVEQRARWRGLVITVMLRAARCCMVPLDASICSQRARSARKRLNVRDAGRRRRDPARNVLIVPRGAASVVVTLAR